MQEDFMTNIANKVKALEEKGISVRSIDRRETIIGEGINFEFWLQTPDQKQHLPNTGEWAANTSVAWVKSTNEIGTLDVTGWSWS